MPQYAVDFELHKHETVEVEAETAADAVRIAREKLGEDGWRADGVESLAEPWYAGVVGTCESCGGYLLEGDAYEWDENSVRWHKQCPKQAAE